MSLHVKYFAVTLAVRSPSWRQWASSYSLQPKLPPALVLNSTSVTEATGRLSQDSNIPSSGLCGYAVCRPLSVHDWHSCLCVQEKKKKRCSCSSEGCDTYSIAVWTARPSWQALCLGWMSEDGKQSVIEGPVKCQQSWGTWWLILTHKKLQVFLSGWTTSN